MRRHHSMQRTARTVCLFLMSAAALTGQAGTVAAEPPGPAHWLYDRMATTPLQRDQFYFSFNFNAAVQQLPRWNSSFSLFAPGSGAFVGPQSFSPEMLGVQPGGEIGYVFRDGVFPAWLGNRVRAGIFGSYFHGQSTINQSFVNPAGAFFSMHAINGNLIIAGAGFAGGLFSETLKIERDAFQVGLKLESDVPLGPNLSLTPAIAVFGGRVHDSYVMIASHTVPGQSPAPLGVSERLRTTEIGGHFGARVTWQFFPGWAAHIGGTVGPVWMRTRFTGENCFNNLFAADDCGPGFAAFFGSTGSGSGSTVGVRGTASLGLAVDARIAVISFGGFARYDSRIPGIANPRAATVAQGTANLPAARVRFDDGFAYGGYFTVRVPLPH